MKSPVARIFNQTGKAILLRSDTLLNSDPLKIGNQIHCFPSLERGAKFIIEIDPNATYRDYVLITLPTTEMTLRYAFEPVIVRVNVPEPAYYTIALLSFVYQYLIGYVGRDGSKTYSSGSLDFRDTYVSIELFHAFYVWIKFRDVSPSKRVYRRKRKDAFGRVECYGKYEPRFKPPREKTDLGTSLKFNYLSLGSYDTQRDAEVVYQIAAHYYGKGEGQVKVEDGSHFCIPPMTELERRLSGKEKAKWVSTRVRKVYEEFEQVKAARTSLPRSDTLLNSDPEYLLDVDDVVSALVEELRGIPSLPSEVRLDALAVDVAHHGFQRMEFPQITNILNCQVGSDQLPSIADLVAGDSDFNIKQENLIQQLINLQKEELEAEFNRKISEQQTQQHQQHLQYQHRQEERILELQQENEDLKSTLHQVMQPLRSHLAEL